MVKPTNVLLIIGTKPKSGVITVDDDGDDDKPSTSKSNRELRSVLRSTNASLLESTATKRKLESGFAFISSHPVETCVKFFVRF